MQMMLVSELRVYPKNLEVYGEENVDDLIKSIKEIGIQHALIVTTSGLIISGNRRYKAARLLGLKEVPVDVRAYKDELDEWETLLECNTQREKTTEQRGKEGLLREEIEKKRAEKRMLGGVKIDPLQHVAEGIGNTRDIVAKKVGLGSGENYRRVKYVLEHSKEFPEEQAKVLKKLLEESTRIAYNIVKEGLVDRLTPDIISKFQELSAAELYRTIKVENQEQEGVVIEVPLRIPEDYPPETVFQCLTCLKRFQIEKNTVCPFCGAENIIESQLDKIPCAYTPPTPEELELLKRLPDLKNTNSFDNPMDKQTAEKLIDLLQRMKLRKNGGWPLKREKKFNVNGQKYSVIAFGVNNEYTATDSIEDIFFIKEH